MKFKSPSDFLFASPRASNPLRREVIATAIYFALASIGCDSPSTENVDHASARTASGVATNGDIALSRNDDAPRNPRDADARDMPCMRNPFVRKVVFALFPHGEKTRVEILFLGGAAS